MPKTFILSDDSINSYGFRLDMERLELDRFKDNPVMFYNHTDLVGRWKNIRIKENVLMAEPDFMSSSAEELSVKISKRVEEGFLKGASLGLKVLSVTKDGDNPPVVVAKVMECSICDIPSNQNSIVLFDESGNKLKGDLFELATKGLKELKTKKENMKLSAKSASTLSIDEGADANAIDVAIEGIHQKNISLTAELKAVKEKEMKTLLDGKSVTADQRKSFEKLASVDFKLAVDSVKALPNKKTLAGTEKEMASLEAEREAWTFDDWRKNDIPALLAIKKADPDRYAKIQLKTKK